MFKIKLKNHKTFTCDKDSTIFEAARKSSIVLEHSCLTSRCRSCVVKVLSGKTINNEDELRNLILDLNAGPKIFKNAFKRDPSTQITMKMSTKAHIKTLLRK